MPLTNYLEDEVLMKPINNRYPFFALVEVSVENEYIFFVVVQPRKGLSTFELAEIYCVSESAIFKRKQKLKKSLGFGSDGRTLDAIVQEL